MEYKTIKVGDILINKSSKVKYQVTHPVNDDTFSMNNLKYYGMSDYINENTAEDYELVESNQNQTDSWF